MKQNIQKFFSNGGKTKLAYWSVILTLFTLLARVIFGGGSYTTQIRVNARDILELKEKITAIEQIQRDIAELKTNQIRILEILQGKYK